MGKGFFFWDGAGCKSEQVIGGCAEDSNSSKARKFFSKKVVAFSVFLLMIICVSAVFAAGRCVPCRANHYCQGGVPIMCPAEKPVTNGTGGVTEADCMSCTTRNGAGNPFFGGYNLGVGLECTSCAEDNEDTPFWNGSACVSCVTANAGTPVWNGSSCEACPENTAWDGTTCAENAASDAECAFTIPHDGGTLCLVEQYSVSAWAEAKENCQSIGARLPSMSELVSIINAVYGTNQVCATNCSGLSSGNTGCCDINGQHIANEALLNFLFGREGAEFNLFSLYSNDEIDSDQVHTRAIMGTSSMTDQVSKVDTYVEHICVK